MQDPQGTSDEGLIVEHITAVYTRDATAEKMCRVPESLRHGVGLCRERQRALASRGRRASAHSDARLGVRVGSRETAALTGDTGSVVAEFQLKNAV